MTDDIADNGRDPYSHRAPEHHADARAPGAGTAHTRGQNAQHQQGR